MKTPKHKIPVLCDNAEHKSCIGKGERHAALYYIAGYLLVICVLPLICLTILWYYPNITFRPEWWFLNLKPLVWVSEAYTMGVQKVDDLVVNFLGGLMGYGVFVLLNRQLEKRTWWRNMLQRSGPQV